MKVLILRFSSIGDIVLTTPVIRNLKKQKKDVELHFATKKSYHTILENNPYIDKIHYLDTTLLSLISELKKEKFDLIIDLHKNLRTLVIKSFLMVKSVSFQKLNFSKWLMTQFKINILPDIHIVDRYMKTIRSLGVVNDNKGLDYFIDEQDLVKENTIPTSHRQQYVAVVMGGKFNTKKLPSHQLISMCKKINKPIILLGGEEEKESALTIERFFIENKEEFPSKIFNGVGFFNLNQAAFILKQSEFVVAHDTGLMHIAAAFQKKIFCVWGNTIPAFGMYPYQTSFTNIENLNLKCRPCSKIGYRQCPKKHFKCMNELKFEF